MFWEASAVRSNIEWKEFAADGIRNMIDINGTAGAFHPADAVRA